MQYLQAKTVNYKKYIYEISPLLACRFMETYHCVPPVEFDELLRQKLPDELAAEISGMLQVKTRSTESDRNPSLPVIRKYIETEIDRYERLAKEMPDGRTCDWERQNQVFLRYLRETEPACTQSSGIRST